MISSSAGNLPPWALRHWRPVKGSPQSKASASLSYARARRGLTPFCPRCLIRVDALQRHGRQWTLGCPSCGRVWKVRRPRGFVYRGAVLSQRGTGSGGK